jgi:diguanylate cyclase (GGDEF)-like protein
MIQKLDELFARSRRSGFFGRMDIIHVLICVLITGLYVFVLYTGRLDRAERILYDYFLRQRPAPAAHPDIVLAEVDRESLQAVGPWPWPWRYHAQMVRLLTQWKARAVIFDFSLKPSEFEEDIPDLEGALAENKHVYMPVFLESKSAKKIYIHSMPIPLEPGGEKQVWAHSPAGVEQKARAIGHGNVIPDQDGIVRRVPVFLSHGGETHAYLPLKAAYGLAGKTLERPSELDIPVDEDGHLPVNWTGPWRRAFSHYSYADIVRSAQAVEKGLQPVVDPGALKDKIVVLAVTAPGISSDQVTPLESSVPVAVIHASVLSSVLSGRLLTAASFVANAFCLSMIGFVATAFFALLRNVGSFIAGLVLGLLWITAAFLLLWQKGIWVFAVHPLLLILSLFIFSAIYTAITGARERSQLFDLATRDGLTGLYVIRHFRDILNRVVAEAQEKKQPVSLILVDIDNFKPINDNFGHPAGDMVLKKTAQVIQSCFRSKRPFHQVDFAARYGGEEFIVLLRNAKLADAACKAAERMRKKIEETFFEWDGKKIMVTVSVGVASLHPGENIPDLMVRRADDALYRAKKTGKNRVCIETIAGD